MTCEAPARFDDGAGGNSHRSRPQDHHPVAWLDASAALDDRVIRHAGRLDQAAGHKDTIAREVLAQWLQAPHGARRHQDVLGIGAIDIETQLIQLFAVIGLTFGAGTALPAPQHLFRGDGFPTFEGLVGALVARILAGFHHHPRKLMPQDARKTG